MSREPRGGPNQIVRAAVDREGPLSGPIWNELRTFLAVAKRRSFNRSADLLGLSHQTIGRHIKRLEDVLAVQLLTTSKRGTVLTERGQELYELLVQVDRDFSATETDFRASRRDRVSNVRIGITDGLGLVYVAPALADFSEEHPRIRIHMRRPNNLRHLREDETDVLIWFQDDRSDDVTSTFLGWCTFAPFASTTYMERHARRGTGAEHLFVDSARFAAGHSGFARWQDLVATGRTAHLCDISVTYTVMVKAGAGIGLLPTYNDMDPSLRRAAPGVEIAIPVYALAMRERLRREPVSTVYDLVCGLFLADTTYLSRAGDAPHDPITTDPVRGYKMLFNL